MRISTQHKVQLMLVGMSLILQAFGHNLTQTYSAEGLWGKNDPRIPYSISFNILFVGLIKPRIKLTNLLLRLKGCILHVMFLVQL